MNDALAWFTAVARDSVALLFLDTVVKATVLLFVACLVAALLRRASAAVRHRVWCLAFSGLLLLPGLSSLLPGWRVPILPELAEPDAAPVASRASVQTSDPATGAPPVPLEFGESGRTTMPLAQRSWSELAGDFDPAVLAGESLIGRPVDSERNDVSTSPPVSTALAIPSDQTTSAVFWQTLMGVIWLLGLSATVLPVVVSLIHNHILGNSARPVVDAERTRLLSDLCHSLGVRRTVRLLETDKSILPMTWGMLRPIVLFPFTWRDWSPERRRFVLLHELAHVKRYDVAFQLLARLACAVYWFHPLAWYALRRLRIERELACDDCVLMAGGRPSDYAQQLVELVRSHRILAMPAAVAIAHSTRLERRVRAVLDQARSHLPLGRTIARVLLVCAALVVTGVAAVRPGTRERPREERTEVAEAELADDRADEPASQVGSNEDETTVSGHVLDSNGQPVRGARVVVVRTYTVTTSDYLTTHEVLLEEKTGADGRFSIRLPEKSRRFSDEASFLQQETYLVALADGYGPDWAFMAGPRPDQDVTLNLVPASSAIEGRVIDLEGRPVAGIRVRPDTIWTAGKPLDEWIAAARNNPTNISDWNALYRSDPEARQRIARFPMYWQLRTESLSIFPQATTNDQGRFRLAGFGDDRLIKLRLDGPGIASTWLDVVTRPMEPVPMPKRDSRYRTGMTFGAKFDYTAEPARPIVGTVRDAETGEPLEGARILLQSYGESTLSAEGFVITTTDAEGRFKLTGLPKPHGWEGSIRLEVRPSPEEPYFRTDVNVPRQEGLGPVTLEIKLKRAIWLTGQVTNSKTEEPVRGLVSYYPFLSNPHAKDYRNFDPGLRTIGYDDQYATDNEGRFRIPALPGRGIVRAVAENPGYYHAGAGADEIEGLIQEDGRSLNVYHLDLPRMASAIREVNADDDAEKIVREIEVVPFQTARLRPVDPEGKPLRGVRVGGRVVGFNKGIGGAFMSYWDRLPHHSEIIEIVGLDVEFSRPVILYHFQRKLGAVLPLEKIERDAGEPQIITLHPCAVVTGRLVDADRQPVGAEKGYVTAGLGKISEIHTYPGPTSRKRIEHSLSWVDRLDENGRFEYFIPPTATYKLMVKGIGKRSGTVISRELTVHPGERIDLGEIDITADAQTRESAKAAEDGEDDVQLRYEGTVVDPDGKAIVGAKIFFVYWIHGAPPDYTVQPLAVTDEQGRFRFSQEKSDFARAGDAQAWRYAAIVASADGFGFAHGLSPAFETTGHVVKNLGVETLLYWKERLKNPKRVLRLVKDDVPITGQVVTIDGQPVPEARIRVDRLWWNEKGTLDAWEKATKDKKADLYSLRRHTTMGMNGPQVPSIIPDAKTDAQGRFTLRGIGRERVVQLLISGPGIETNMAKARTRVGEKVVVPHQWDSRNRGIGGIKDEIYFGASFVHVPGPSKPVVGRVTDADTGEALAGVAVSAGQRGMFFAGGLHYIATFTDATGRYRLEGLPIGGRDRIYVFPPSETAYLPAGQRVDTQTDKPEITRNFKLKRGVWVRGQAVDDRTGKPLPGRVRYYAFANNPHLESYARFSGARYHERNTDGDGRFEIAVLPGAGIVTFMALDHTRYRKGLGAETITAPTDAVGGDTKMFRTVPSALFSTSEHVLRQIDPVQDGSIR